MKLSKTQKNLLKPVMIIVGILYVPCMIISDFFGSFFGTSNYLGKESFIDKLGSEVFSE